MRLKSSAERCEERMRELTGGEVGCANPSEHESRIMRWLRRTFHWV